MIAVFPNLGLCHDPPRVVRRRCRCGCAAFTSDFGCIVCDGKWEAHETVFENVQERVMAGRPVGESHHLIRVDIGVSRYRYAISC